VNASEENGLWKRNGVVKALPAEGTLAGSVVVDGYCTLVWNYAR
jgi:hypothetical protein